LSADKSTFRFLRPFGGLANFMSGTLPALEIAFIVLIPPVVIDIAELGYKYIDVPGSKACEIHYDMTTSRVFTFGFDRLNNHA
jgi:hypothetical protein